MSFSKLHHSCLMSASLMASSCPWLSVSVWARLYKKLCPVYICPRQGGLLSTIPLAQELIIVSCHLGAWTFHNLIYMLRHLLTGTQTGELENIQNEILWSSGKWKGKGSTQEVNCGLSIVNCRLSISISLKLYTKVSCHHPPPTTTTTTKSLILLN